MAGVNQGSSPSLVNLPDRGTPVLLGPLIAHCAACAEEGPATGQPLRGRDPIDPQPKGSTGKPSAPTANCPGGEPGEREVGADLRDRPAGLEPERTPGPDLQKGQKQAEVPPTDGVP